MTPLRAVIVDDEALAREAVRNALSRRDDVELVAEAANGIDAIETIASTRPDLVFLDVAMPGVDGFGVVRALDLDPAPLVVFVTAYDQYALDAFKVEALDYLLKPVTDEAVEHVIERAHARRPQDRLALFDRVREAIERLRPRGEESFLAGGTGGKWIVVRSADLHYVDAADNYVRLHTAAGEALLRGSLKAFATRLDPVRFVRIHRSFIVDLERVRELRPLPSGDYEVLLASGRTLPMSRSYRDEVLGRWRARP